MFWNTSESVNGEHKMEISLHSQGKDLNGDDFIDSPEARMAMYEKMKNLVGLPSSTSSSPVKTATSESSASSNKENVNQYDANKSPSENVKSFASAASRRKVSFNQETKDQTKKTGGGILKNSSTGKKLPKNAAEIRKSLQEAESRIGRAKLVEKEMSFRGLKDVDDTGHKDEKNLWSDEAMNERKPASELMHRAKSLRSFSMRKLNVVKEDDEEEAPARPELPTSKSFARAPPRRGFNHRDSMEMMEQTGHSVSFYKPRVVDHFDLKADISLSPSKETKGVTFSVVEVKEYPYTIGSNPSVSGGIPLTVEWDSSHFVQVPIDEHERIRVPERRNMVELKIPKDIRIDMLLNAGHTIKEISSEIKKNDRLRLEKLETKQTLYRMPKDEKWERIRRAFSSCFTSRKRKERAFMERAYSFSY